MNVKTRLEKLESTSAFAGPAVREVTEEEFFGLSDEDKTNYLRGSLQLTVLQDPEEEQFPMPRAADINHIADAELDEYKKYMDGRLARSAARQSARQAAKAAAVPPRTDIEE